MEKQFMSVEDLKAADAGRAWVDGAINQLMLPAGKYTFGAISIKEATINGKITRYPIIEVNGFGTVGLGRVLANELREEVPTLAQNKKSWYFRQKPVNDLFTGDLAAVAVGLQGMTVMLSVHPARQQGSFPEKGKPWATADEATKGAGILTKDVYKVEKILSAVNPI
jgi:hypothetical protein